VFAPDWVFPCMGTDRKQSRSPRFIVVDTSSALTPNISHPNLTTIEGARDTATAPEATRPLVRYFDDHHGFWRVGWLISSRTVARGRQKGKVILTIVSVRNQRLTRYSDEVEAVQ
jgi:hypothetical protein